MPDGRIVTPDEIMFYTSKDTMVHYRIDVPVDDHNFSIECEKADNCVHKFYRSLLVVSSHQLGNSSVPGPDITFSQHSHKRAFACGLTCTHTRTLALACKVQLVANAINGVKQITTNEC